MKLKKELKLHKAAMLEYNNEKEVWHQYNKSLGEKKNKQKTLYREFSIKQTQYSTTSFSYVQ